MNNEPSRTDFNYFDVLPLHPQPQHLETLSSYIKRVAEANDFYQKSAFRKFLNIWFTKEEYLTDYPHHFFKEVSQRTICSETQLLATTLYYAGQKFEYSAHSNVLSRFFSESLGSHLRYCPACISDSAYYPLTWRFLQLSGCSIHQCRLLDQCGHCGQKVALFSISSRIGLCPTCKKDLQFCHTEMLTELDRAIVQRQTSELEYLLSPCNDADESSGPRLIGKRFRRLRQEKGYEVGIIAEMLKVNVRSIKILETGNRNRRITFRMYTQFAEFLGVSLYDILANFSQLAQFEQGVIQVIPSYPTQSKKEIQIHRELIILEKFKNAIDELQKLKQRITLVAIAKRVHMSRTALKMYPSVLKLWEQVSSEQREERRKKFESDLIERLQEAILILKDQNVLLSTANICKNARVSFRTLGYYENANAFLNQTIGVEADIQNLLPDEQSVVEKIQEVIATLRANEQIVTQEKVCNEVGLSHFILVQYPQARNILEQAIEYGRLQRRNQAQVHQQEIVERVKEAIEYFKCSEQLASQKAIAEHVGIAVDILRRYPAVRLLFSEASKEYKQQVPQRRQQRESELMERVQQAILYLRQKGLSITQKAIGDFVGCSDTCLLSYQGFREHYKHIKEEERNQLFQQREEMLLAQIQNAITQLTNQKQRITLTSIAKRVGMTVTSLRKYPRINTLFQDLLDERRSIDIKRKQS